MNNKPIIIFTAFMVVALVVIVGYLTMSNPFGAVSSATASDQSMDDQQVMILYLHNCASCHGPAGNGLNGNPSLINNGLSETAIDNIIKNGRGKMVGLPKLTEDQVQKLASFVKRF